MYKFRIKIMNDFRPFNFNLIQNQVSNSYAKIVVVGNIERVSGLSISSASSNVEECIDLFSMEFRDVSKGRILILCSAVKV